MLAALSNSSWYGLQSVAWSLNVVLPVPVPGTDEWFVCRAWSDSRLWRRCHLQRVAGSHAGFPTQGVFFVQWTKTEYLLHFQLCSHHVLILKATTTQVLSKPRTPLWLPTSLPTQPSGSVYAHACMHTHTHTHRYRHTHTHAHAINERTYIYTNLSVLLLMTFVDGCFWELMILNWWSLNTVIIETKSNRAVLPWSRFCWKLMFFFIDYCLTWSIGLTRLQITRFTVWTLRLCKLYCSDEHWTIYQLQQPFLMHYYFVFVLTFFV